MIKRISKFTVLLVLLITGVIFMSHENTPISEKRALASVEKMTLPQEIQTNENPTIITENEFRKLHESLPQVDEVKEEFEMNPHQTPKSLRTFAREMGPLMEKGLEDLDEAEKLRIELTKCAGDTSVATAARALCVQDVEKLADAHPQMKKKSQDLRATVSSEIQKILNTKDAFIKK